MFQSQEPSEVTSTVFAQETVFYCSWIRNYSNKEGSGVRVAATSLHTVWLTEGN